MLFGRILTLFGKPEQAAHLEAGQKAEDFALAHLQAQGLALVERNYRCRGGEIDLIMRDGGKLVFVEVRYRRDERFGGALASVGTHKQKRLLAAAAHYLAAKRVDRPVRFDVAAVSPDQGRLTLQWVKDAFRAR